MRTRLLALLLFVVSVLAVSVGSGSIRNVVATKSKDRSSVPFTVRTGGPSSVPFTVRLVGSRSTSATSIPSPKDVMGFTPGDDRKLASWAQIVDYFQKLDAASDRVMFEEIGKTTMWRPFTVATITAPENMARLLEYKDIQDKLADPRKLGANADRKAAELIKRGKTIIVITCSIHSTEVGGALSSMLMAYRLASSDEPLVKEILQNTIILLVPSLNPDGVDIVKNWYDKTLGTPYEGTSPPELYHKYTGHDNNRDWYAFTQVETQLTVDKILNVWHPQIVHDIHQQGSNGSRLFLPPYMKPVEPNVPKQIVEGYTELGSYMMDELHAQGLVGITNDSTYDAWSPSRAYSHYHGGVRILSETASVRIASPITVQFNQLRPGEGYDPRKASPNFPKLWMGGEWHLRDITNYMTSAAFVLMKHAAQNRRHWLSRFYEIGKEAVRSRSKGELAGFRIVRKPTDLFHSLEQLGAILRRGGVEIEWTSDEPLVRYDQPYGAFAKAVLETQLYPNMRDSQGNPVQPYDVTAHSLPLLMGVDVRALKGLVWSEYDGFDPDSIRRTTYAFPKSRVGLYKSYVPSMDEGWTRWVLDAQSKLTYLQLIDRDVRSGSLLDRFDSIILPDQAWRSILNGHRKGTMPDEYTGGVGEEGVKALREFVEAGGTLILFNKASDFAIEQFKLPLRDITAGLPRTEFYCPGSILRTELDTTNPIARGMPRESIAWFEDSPVFEITDQSQASRVHIIAKYPSSSDPLLSGWLLGGDKIKGKAALVEVEMGKGRVILFGFRPQYRGQSLATYPLIFNAISLGPRASRPQ